MRTVKQSLKNKLQFCYSFQNRKYLPISPVNYSSKNRCILIFGKPHFLEVLPYGSF